MLWSCLRTLVKETLIVCLCLFVFVPGLAWGQGSLEQFRKEQLRKKLKKQAEARKRRKKTEAFHKKAAPVLFWTGVGFSAVGAVAAVGSVTCAFAGVYGRSKEYFTLKECEGDSFLAWFPKETASFALQTVFAGSMLLIGAVLLQTSLFIEPSKKKKRAAGPVLLAVGGGVTLLGLALLGQGVFRMTTARLDRTRLHIEVEAKYDYGVQQAIGGAVLFGIGASYLVTGALLWRR